MKKITLYEYDKRNRGDFLKQLDGAGYAFLSIMAGDDIQNLFNEITADTRGVIMDVTPLFRDDERCLSFAVVIEKIIENMQANWPAYFIIDRRYTCNFENLLFYRLEKVESLEVVLGLEIPKSRDIVSLCESEFK